MVPTISDHRLMILQIKTGRNAVGGPGLWKHNDKMLADDEYCTLVENSIDEALEAESDDVTFKWEWLKHKVREMLCTL
jgi:hypothetical protein